MLSRKELLAYQKITGFTLGQIEKDYLQHILLSLIYKSITHDLIFKGGTALQKTYNLNRFSEDLDFTLNADVDINTMITQALTSLKFFGIKSAKRQTKQTANAYVYKIKIQGPLYKGIEISNAFIRLEISTREKLVLPVTTQTITPLYTDLPPYSVLMMNPSEIMAEKIRAILTRNKARDIYDLWFLITKQVKTSTALINNKLNYYNTHFDSDLFEKSIKQKEKIWKKEMQLILPLNLDFSDLTSTHNA